MNDTPLSQTDQNPNPNPNPAPITSTPDPAQAPTEPPKKDNSTLKVVLIIIGILAVIVLAPGVFASMMFIKTAMEPVPTYSPLTEPDSSKALDSSDSSDSSDSTPKKSALLKKLEQEGFVTEKDDNHPTKCQVVKDGDSTYTVYGKTAGDCARVGTIVSGS